MVTYVGSRYVVESVAQHGEVWLTKAWTIDYNMQMLSRLSSLSLASSSGSSHCSILMAACLFLSPR